MIKTVLITGCSTGIGRALTEVFLQQGYRVYATARNTQSLNDLQHPELRPLAMDVNSDEDVAATMTAIEADSGYLNCLINNAGYAAMGPVTELTHDKLLLQFSTNVFAPVALTKACLPLLRKAASEQQPAQVVNIGSVSGILTTPFSGAYCATKAALHSLTDALRMELAPFNIDVITVQPGAIQSSFGKNSLASLDGLLEEGSLYSPVRSFIEARANASQDNPTPAADFANTLIAQLMSKPAPVIRIGNGSTALPFLKRWVPLSLLDRILKKKFGLNKTL